MTSERKEGAVTVTCACQSHCGDDGAIDGPGLCMGLPPYRPPLVEIVMVPRQSAPEAPDA